MAWGQWIAGGGGPAKGEQVMLPECPTPDTQEEYIEVASATLEKVKRLLNSSGWTEVPFENDFVKLFEKPDPTGGPIPLIKTQAEMPCSARELYDLVNNASVEERKAWEKSLLSAELIETITEDIKVVRTTHAAPFPVTTRELVAIKCAAVEGEVYYSYGTSINRSDCTADPSLVRAVALFGFAFRPKPGQSNCCLCEEVVKLDPKGNIPSFAINLGKKKAAIGLHMLRKEVMQYRAAKQREESERIPIVQAEEQKEKLTPVLPSVSEPILVQATRSTGEEGAGAYSALMEDEEGYQECIEGPTVTEALQQLQNDIAQVNRKTELVLERISAVQKSRQESQQQTSRLAKPRPSFFKLCQIVFRSKSFLLFVLVYPFIACAVYDFLLYKRWRRRG